MTIKIGEKIKRLRKKNDITQERLAEYIGVTAQAISRWESETCYPDIETLPTIADFFGITLDELMCIDQTKREERIEEYIVEGNRLAELSKLDEALVLFRKAVFEFPSSFCLQFELASILACKNNRADYNKNELTEAIAIYNRILEDCLDDELRDQVKESLCCIYSMHGNQDKALEIANKMHKLSYSRELMKATILKGDVAFIQSQKSIELLTDYLNTLMMNIATSAEISGNNYSINEKIEVLQKANKLIELIFDNNYYFYNCRLGENYRRLCLLYILNNDNNSALDALETAMNYMIQYDNRPDEANYKSLLLSRVKYSTHEYHEIKSFSQCHNLLNKLSNTVYNPIRGNERFKAVVENLETQH